MTKDQVERIILEKRVPHPTLEMRLVETHISWVILADSFVYKIKKPLRLSFLDFSTFSKRAYYCEQEVLLNRRLAPEMYLGVLPVTNASGNVTIGGQTGEVIDHVVWMRRMDDSRQLDLLLAEGEVEVGQMDKLAGILARFHQGARRVKVAETWKELYEEFADISGQATCLDEYYKAGSGAFMEEVIHWGYGFLRGIQARIEERKGSGFVVDGHGDLHCRNIILGIEPVIFDCIEFSEALRTLDVLNEVAFLCMDLERFGRDDLAKAFLDRYLTLTGAIENRTDRLLFLYYKLYRANVRIKVLCIQLKEDEGGSDPKGRELIEKYMLLFRRYYLELKAAWEAGG
jgi:aminoglycoside phosphotransferase family enzyme